MMIKIAGTESSVATDHVVREDHAAVVTHGESKDVLGRGSAAITVTASRSRPTRPKAYAPMR